MVDRRCLVSAPALLPGCSYQAFRRPVLRIARAAVRLYPVPFSSSPCTLESSDLIPPKLLLWRFRVTDRLCLVHSCSSSPATRESSGSCDRSLRC